MFLVNNLVLTAAAPVSSVTSLLADQRGHEIWWVLSCQRRPYVGGCPDHMQFSTAVSLHSPVSHGQGESALNLPLAF